MQILRFIIKELTYVNDAFYNNQNNKSLDGFVPMRE